MAIVQRKLRNGKTANWIVLRWQGEQEWIHGGYDARAAKRQHDEIAKQIEAKTYVPGVSKRCTNAAWLERYLDWRETESKGPPYERQALEHHVLSVTWFGELAVSDTRPKDVERLISEIRKVGKIGEKTIANTFTVLSGAFKRAVFEELRSDNPCEGLPPGTIRRRSAKKKRFPYLRSEVRQILACEEVSLPMRVFLHLAFYTGMRKGEICGRRWRDWDRLAQPLGGLLVHTQYDDQPLKTDDEEEAHPRVVPVHPELAKVLTWWWAEGFELVYCRKPQLDDFIVPTFGTAGGHSASSAYKAFRTAIKVAGVANRTLHSSRHTFVSVARSSGAEGKVVERITHNSEGDGFETIETYTDFEWEAMCNAVLGVDYSVDRNARPAFFVAPTLGLEAGPSSGDTGGDGSKHVETDGSEEPPNHRQHWVPPAPVDPSQVRQARLLALATIDPEGAKPGLAVCRAADRVATGDLAGAVEELRQEAVRRG
ncbi:MAG TPA: site-specific integrase [Steroidobacteraceae bacterium]|jgi:integrase|nr:site-specific integrase [Steroidobacteraceae bacterium]